MAEIKERGDELDSVKRRSTMQLSEGGAMVRES